MSYSLLFQSCPVSGRTRTLEPLLHRAKMPQKRRRKQLDWFARLFGFREVAHAYQEVQNLLVVDGTTITSKKNNKSYQIGHFVRETLGEQRARIMKKKELQHVLEKKHGLSLEIKVGDVTKLHMMPSNRHATFQVMIFTCATSQFSHYELHALL